MPDALLFVLSEPGHVDEAAFHDWYDHDHGPARLRIPGIRSGTRYRALDGSRPGWLATYDCSMEALESDEYRALRAERSPVEQTIVDALETLDRRVYELLDDRGGTPVEHAPVVVCTSLSTTDPAGLTRWYTDEHVPMLHAVEGWWRTRRYRIVDGDAPTFLALHEVASADVFDDPLYRRAVGTPWRERTAASVTARERRVFGYHTAIKV
jgi:hypothetical protein